jgi:chemotaxis protein CheZ
MHTATDSFGDRVVNAILAAEPEDSPRRPILEEARRMVIGLLDSFERAISTEQERLRRELDSLAGMIATMKQEVDTIRADEIETRHMPTVNGEIGAIAAHLESATGQILDACENIETVLEPLDAAVADPVRDQVTRIYEACNFHDISGQRIRKILDTLQTVEERIGALLAILGQRPDRPKRPPSDMVEARPSLLEGPQLPGNGRSQDEIDALFG